MHPRPRGALLSLLATALALTARIPGAVLRAAESINDSTPESGFPVHRRSRGLWGQGKKRYHEIRDGKRVAVAAGSQRPAAKWLPNVPGHRYEMGRLIPRPWKKRP